MLCLFSIFPFQMQLNAEMYSCLEPLVKGIFLGCFVKDWASIYSKRIYGSMELT